MSELIEVPTGRLVPHPLQPRLELGAETVASVREAIALEAGRFPKAMAITVRRRDEGGFEILAGHHRVEAARQAKAPTVWAFIQPMTDVEAALFLAASNSHTEMTPFEHGRHALALNKEFGVPLIDYARRMGRSSAWVSQVVAAYQVLEDHGGVDHAYADLPYTALAQAARVKSSTKREEVLVEMMGHRNPAAIASQLVAAVERGERPAAAVRRLDVERRPVGRQPKIFDTPDAGGTHVRPELAARAHHATWLAQMIDGIAFALQVREEELERRKPNLSDPRQAKVFHDAVEDRIRREYPSTQCEARPQAAAS